MRFLRVSSIVFFFLFDSWYAAARCSLGQKIMADGRSANGSWAPGQHVVTLRDQVIGGTASQCLDGQAGIGRTLGGEQAAITDEEVADVVRAPKAVCDGGAWVAAHARSADQVSVTRLVDNLFCPRGVQHFCRFIGTEPGDLFIVIVQADGDFRYTQAVPVGVIGQFY